MHVLTINFNGIQNIGLYGFVNDNVALLGKEIPDDIANDISKVLKVPVHKITIAGTSLIGVFVAGNNNKLIVPSIIFDDERKVLEELNVPFEVFDTKLTCLGNNLVVGSKSAILSKEFTEVEEKKIADLLNIETYREKLGGVFSVGSLVVLNMSKKCALMSNDFTRDDQKLLEKVFDVVATPGSVNMGSPYVRSGILCNSNGFVIGSNSGGPEINNADEALGFLN
ncbi:MAG: translation initiation factor IF-6 [Candidatus Woesearchaeota archaeon]